MIVIRSEVHLSVNGDDQCECGGGGCPLAKFFYKVCCFVCFGFSFMELSDKYDH